MEQAKNGVLGSNGQAAEENILGSLGERSFAFHGAGSRLGQCIKLKLMH